MWTNTRSRQARKAGTQDGQAGPELLRAARHTSPCKRAPGWWWCPHTSNAARFSCVASCLTTCGHAATAGSRTACGASGVPLPAPTQTGQTRRRQAGPPSRNPRRSCLHTTPTQLFDHVWARRPYYRLITHRLWCFCRSSARTDAAAAAAEEDAPGAAEPQTILGRGPC